MPGSEEQRSRDIGSARKLKLALIKLVLCLTIALTFNLIETKSAFAWDVNGCAIKCADGCVVYEGSVAPNAGTMATLTQACSSRGGKRAPNCGGGESVGDNCSAPVAPNPPACGVASGNTYATAPQTASALCANGTASGVSGSGPWNWTCAVGSVTANCSSGICNPPVAGGCDNNTLHACTNGGAAFAGTEDGNNWYWQCHGLYGGADSGTCQKAKPINGSCSGTLWACNSGTPANGRDDANNWYWECNGANGGGSPTCTIAKPVNGSCSGTLWACNAGTPANGRDDANNWYWECNGANGGSSPTCTIAKPVTTPGGCDNNTVNACTNGGAAFAGTDDANNNYWYCHSPNGGADSGQCSKAKACSLANKKLDVYFLADNTGSMQGPIDSVRNRASSLLSRMTGGDARFSNVDSHFAVGRYFGDPSEGAQQTCPIGYTEAFVQTDFAGTVSIGCRSDGTENGTPAAYIPVDSYDMLQGMTGNLGAVQAGISHWQAIGGGDQDEGQFYAMTLLANAGSSTGWRSDAQHILIWMGDAPGHQQTRTINQAISALQANNVSVISLKILDTYAQIAGVSGRINNEFDTIANATGGRTADITTLSDDDIANLIVNSVYNTAIASCH